MNCPVCNSPETRVIANSFEFSKLYPEFTYLNCEACENIAILPPLSNSDMGQGYIREFTFSEPKLNPSIVKRVKKFITKYSLFQRSGVYDIGAGNCQYSMAFKSLGFNSVAVDVERLNPYYSPFVYFGDLNAALDVKESHIFFSNHSFEHIDLSDLSRLCNLIASRMREPSVGVFVVPIAKRNLVRRGIYLEEFVYGHKNLFSKTSAEFFFKKQFPERLNLKVVIDSPKTRFAFLRTRLQIFSKYLKDGFYAKALILAYYLVISLIFGAEEELWISIQNSA
jgi:hypothetical protein